MFAQPHQASYENPRQQVLRRDGWRHAFMSVNAPHAKTVMKTLHSSVPLYFSVLVALL